MNRIAGALMLLLALAGAPFALYAVAPQKISFEVEGHPFALWHKSALQPGNVILLIHGRTWSTLPDFDLQVAGESRSLMDGLVERGFSVYGLDLRGYGQTPRDESGWLTPLRAANDVLAALRFIAQREPADQKPMLFGWSLGSMVAQMSVQLDPQAVSGLVLFGYPVRDGMTVDPPGAGSLPPRTPTTAENAASDFILPDAISVAAVQSFVSAALAADPVRMDWRRLEQWQALDGSRISTPTLLMEGAEDPLTQADVHARLFNRINHSNRMWVVLPHGAHAAFMESPRDQFLATIALFADNL